jgi:hypothetical protein
MTPQNDPLEMLASYRPTEDQLNQDWPAVQRTAMRQRIGTSARPTGIKARFTPPVRRHRKPWPALAGLVGAAAAALLAVQLMQPSAGPRRHPGAGGTHGQPGVQLAALQRLAVAAQATPADVVHPGQFRHLISSQSNGLVVESWTAYNGDTWQRREERDGSQGTPTVEYWRLPHTYDGLNGPSPRFLATLPTDPDQLQSYLLSHVCGSSSRDEAVFVGIGDMLRGDFASTALRVAAIRVLERTAHITTHQARDTLGHSVLQVDFIDPAIRPGETQSLLFDPNTAMVRQEQDHGPGNDYTSTNTDSRTVDSVPALVRSRAVVAGDAGTPPPSPAPACTWDEGK